MCANTFCMSNRFGFKNYITEYDVCRYVKEQSHGIYNSVFTYIIIYAPHMISQKYKDTLIEISSSIKCNSSYYYLKENQNQLSELHKC